MASRARDREEFVSIMALEGVSLDDARALMRAAATLHRLAELECSSEAADRDRVSCPPEFRGRDSCLCRDYGTYYEPVVRGRDDYPPHGKVPRIAVQGARLEKRVRELCAKHNLTPVFSGDPRGAVLKVKVPSGKTNDWGQTGVCVP